MVKVCQDLNVAVKDNAEDISQLQTDVEAVSEAVTDAVGTVSGMEKTVEEVKKSNSDAVNAVNAAVKTVNGMNDRVIALEDLGLFIGEDGNIYQEED